MPLTVEDQRLLPPGPRRPPLLQVLGWVYRPVQFLSMCAKRYGDWFTLRFPRGCTFAFTTDPEAIRQVFAGDPDKLHAGKANAILKPLLGDHSLLLLDGPDHLRERPFPIQPHMQSMTLDIILRTVFGVAEGPRLTELRDAINVMLRVGTNSRIINFVGRDGKIPFAAL